MKKFTILFATLVITVSFSFGQTELYYDNDTYTGWQVHVPERVFAVHFSPTGPCEVLILKYYVDKVGLAEGVFATTLYNWEGTVPAEGVVYEQATFVVSEGWKEQNVEGDITFEGDFVVGYSPADPAAYLAVDDDLNTGRNWVFDITNTTWSEVTDHSYLIRAIVQYEVGVTEELVGTPIEVYPNPVVDYINIKAEMEVESVTIMNTIGQVVYHALMDQKSTKIDLSNYESGIYFVRMNTEDKTITKKIVVN